MRNFIKTLAIAALLLPSCAGTETGNPTPPSKLSLGLVSSAPSAIAVGTGDAPLVVESYALVLGTFGYQECPAASEQIVNLVDGRRPTDLVSGLELSVPADSSEGDYCGAWLGSLIATAGDDVPEGLRNDRLFITGVRSDGAPFEVNSDVELRIKLRTTEPLPRRDGRISAVLSLDIAGPVAALGLEAATPDADGTIRVAQRMRDGTLDAAFADALAASGILFDDVNGNGRLDDGEPQLVP